MVGRDRTLIVWRAVFGAAVMSLATFLLLTALWTALATQGDTGIVNNNLEWFIGASAIFALFFGGFLAGWLSGVRGMLAGIVNGSTLWGLFILTSLAIGVPTAMNLVNVGSDPAAVTTGVIPGGAAWTVFWSLLIGNIAAMLGGMIGGAVPRSTGSAYREEEHYEHDEHDEHDRERPRMTEVPPHDHRAGGAIDTGTERREPPRRVG